METSLKYTYLVHSSVHNGHEDNQEKYNDDTQDVIRVFEEDLPLPIQTQMSYDDEKYVHQRKQAAQNREKRVHKVASTGRVFSVKYRVGNACAKNNQGQLPK